MPKVSVIIPSYNCAKYLPDALESVFNQAFQDFEIVIIDDGSRDNTKDVLAPYLSQYPGRIKYVYQENKGLAIARNTGIGNAAGELIALLDADDLWCPQHLEEEVKLMESDPKIGLVHANITRMTEEKVPMTTPKREAQFLSGDIFEHLFLRKADISCPTVLFRKSCCDRVGLFDEDLTRLGCEDRDLWLRIAREYKIAYIDKVLAFYRIREGSLSRNQQKMIEARYFVVNKFFPENSKNGVMRKLALAKIHKDMGDELLFLREFEAAKKEYCQSLSLTPFSFWPWVNFLKASLKMKIKM